MAFDFAHQSPRERPRQRPPAPPTKPARVEQVKQKTLAELQQDAQNVMSEALSAIDVMERSSSFGISIRDYAENVTKDLRAYDAILQRSEEDIQRALGAETTLGIRDHRQVTYLLERIRNMRQRIARVAILEPKPQDKSVTTSAPSLKGLKQMQELMRQPKDTDTPPSPWATYRQDLNKRREHLPPQEYTSVPPHGETPNRIEGLENQGFSQSTQDTSPRSAWANWKSEPQPVKQNPSWLSKRTTEVTKTATAVSRWFKSLF